MNRAAQRPRKNIAMWRVQVQSQPQGADSHTENDKGPERSAACGADLPAIEQRSAMSKKETAKRFRDEQ